MESPKIRKKSPPCGFFDKISLIAEKKAEIYSSGKINIFVHSEEDSIL